MSQSTNRSSGDALQRLQNVRSELVQKLLQNSDYRALVAIDQALSELGAATNGRQHVPTAAPKPSRLPMASKLSQTEAAAQILREAGKPLALDELVRGLVDRGIAFRGKRPELSLSASLSSNKQFRSIRFDGGRCWWLSNRPIPARTAVDTASEAISARQA